MPETVTLAGRKFEVLNQLLTASQDDYILAHLRVARALDILHDAEETTSPDLQRIKLLLTRIQLTGETDHILAGCLTEIGKTWSRAEADRNAAAFGEITDQDEKNARRALTIKLVTTFLGLAARSTPISPIPTGTVTTAKNAEPAAPEPLLH